MVTKMQQGINCGSVSQHAIQLAECHWAYAIIVGIHSHAATTPRLRVAPR